MLEITILNAAKQEETILFESYEAFHHSMQFCSAERSDHYKVVKLVYKGHQLDYSGTYGDLFFYFLNKDLTAYDQAQ